MDFRPALIAAADEWASGGGEVLVLRTREQMVELGQWSPVAPQPMADELPSLAEAIGETMNYRFKLWPLSHRHHLAIISNVGDRYQTMAQARVAFAQMAEMGLRLDRSAISDVRIGAAFIGESDTDRSDSADLAGSAFEQAEMALAETTDERPFVSYNATIGQTVSTASELAGDLADAVSRGEVDLGLQHRRTIAGSPVGVEALARWYHWRHGLVSSQRLLMVAEQTGQLPELGRRLRLRAAKAVQEWTAEGLPVGREVYCNIAPLELCHRSFRSGVRELQRLFPDVEIHLELTDGSILDRSPVRLAMKDAADMGCRILLDGVEPNKISIERLQALPIVGINLDGSFTKLLGRDKVVNRLAEVVVETADQRGLTVTACQVEGKSQLSAAEAYGIERVQGDLFDSAQLTRLFAETLRSMRDTPESADVAPAS